MGGRPGGPAEPATAPMLPQRPEKDRLEREMAALRDRLVRLQSLGTDTRLNLPHSVGRPDNEECRAVTSQPSTSSQNPVNYQSTDYNPQDEVKQRCVKGPPNKTVFDTVSPPPHRPTPPFLAECVGVKCHRRTEKTGTGKITRTERCMCKKCHIPGADEVAPNIDYDMPGPLYVMVPTRRSRRLTAFSPATGSKLESLPTVKCANPDTSTQDNSERDTGQNTEPGTSCSSDEIQLPEYYGMAPSDDDDDDGEVKKTN